MNLETTEEDLINTIFPHPRCRAVHSVLDAFGRVLQA